jgi:hypothetical protein
VEHSGRSATGARAGHRRVREALVEAEFLDRVADLLADRVVERLAPYLGASGIRPEGLVDASEVARIAGRSRHWVYEHAGMLGAVPLGDGQRTRLGFHPARVREYLSRSVANSERRPVPRYAAPRRRKPRAAALAYLEFPGETPLDPRLELDRGLIRIATPGRRPSEGTGPRAPI